MATDLLSQLVGKVETAEIPKPAPSKTAEPNPFEGRFPADEKSLVFTIEGAADGELAKKLTSQARRAAQAVDRTARVKTEQGGTKAKPTTTFTVWTIARVTRPRGSENGNATETAQGKGEK